MEWDAELGPGRAAGARGRGGASRTCSPTPPARPGGRRARCTCTAASCSRSHGRRPTSPTSAPATASSSRPTWAGSWGPWTVVGAGALGACVDLHGRRAGLAGRPALAARRGGARDDARRLADPRPRADPEGRARGRSLLAARDHDDRRAVERRPVRLAERARRRRRAHSDHQHLRRHRGRRVLPLRHADGAVEARLARLPGARTGDGRLLAGGRSRCAARSASSSARMPGPG